jgi:hypothetical protein
MMTEKEELRWHALADITSLLSAVQNGSSGIRFARDHNPYIDDKKKYKISRQRDEIIRQLTMRFSKLDMKIGRP